MVHRENQLEDPVPTLEIKTGLEHLQTIGAIEEVGASGMFRIEIEETRDQGILVETRREAIPFYLEEALQPVVDKIKHRL